MNTINESANKLSDCNGDSEKTKRQIETPLKPTTFAMTLRKYLMNGRITEIVQHEFDRIIKIKISKSKCHGKLKFVLYKLLRTLYSILIPGQKLVEQK